MGHASCLRAVLIESFFVRRFAFFARKFLTWPEPKCRIEAAFLSEIRFRDVRNLRKPVLKFHVFNAIFDAAYEEMLVSQRYCTVKHQPGSAWLLYLYQIVGKEQM